jgi:hypothetical protein
MHSSYAGDHLLCVDGCLRLVARRRECRCVDARLCCDPGQRFSRSACPKVKLSFALLTGIIAAWMCPTWAGFNGDQVTDGLGNMPATCAILAMTLFATCPPPCVLGLTVAAALVGFKMHMLSGALWVSLWMVGALAGWCWPLHGMWHGMRGAFACGMGGPCIGWVVPVSLMPLVMLGAREPTSPAMAE